VPERLGIGAPGARDLLRLAGEFPELDELEAYAVRVRIPAAYCPFIKTANRSRECRIGIVLAATDCIIRALAILDSR
jgi:hypothetical protein